MGNIEIGEDVNLPKWSRNGLPWFKASELPGPEDLECGYCGREFPDGSIVNVTISPDGTGYAFLCEGCFSRIAQSNR